MYSFIKDIKFMEDLLLQGFSNAYCVTLVEDHLFYEGNDNSGIYSFFRQEYSVYGHIGKPTGPNKNSETSMIQLRGKYPINWTKLSDGRKYYIVDLKT